MAGIPGLRTYGPDKCRGVKRSCADLHVIGLLNNTPLFRPVVLQGRDQPLECREIELQKMTPE